MKQAKATVKEAEALLRWLQKQENADRQPPPYNRTIFGYLLMLEHCADPAKDYIDFRPGTSPDEIAALKQRAEAAEARVDSLMRDNEEQRMKVREEITKRAELEAQNARLLKALEDQLKLAEKQVEFYKDRVDSGEEHLRPFGSEAWRRAKDLKKALNGEEASK